MGSLDSIASAGLSPAERCQAELRFVAYGDSAVLVERHCDDPVQQWAVMQSLSSSLRAADLPGIEGNFATFTTLLVSFDPLVTDAETLETWLRAHVPNEEIAATTGRIVEIPMTYGGEYGPDLEDVARHLELTPDEVVELHSSTLWRVAFNGAPAGTPLHEGSPWNKPVPRMPTPRVKIAAGTIALAGHQGTIYTIPAPGGWRLIGRTPLQIINPKGDPFVAIDPGDQLRFVPITPEEFDATPNVFIGELL